MNARVAVIGRRSFVGVAEAQAENETQTERETRVA